MLLLLNHGMHALHAVSINSFRTILRTSVGVISSFIRPI